MADQALRPLPGASTTLHRADVLRTHIDDILSIGEVQAPSLVGSLRISDWMRWMTPAFPGPGRVILAMVEETDNTAWVPGRLERKAREPAPVRAAPCDRLVRLVGGFAAAVLVLAIALVLFVPAAHWLAHHDIGSARDRFSRRHGWLRRVSC